MTGRMVERACWAATAVAGVVGLLTARLPAGPTAPGGSVPPVQLTVNRPGSSSLNRWAALVNARDVFQLAGVLEDDWGYAGEAEVNQAPEPPPVPPLTLVGVLGGPPWEALVAGVPDHAGSILVREGDRVAGFQVVRVARDTVRLQGADTTLILTLRRPWQ